MKIVIVIAIVVIVVLAVLGFSGLGASFLGGSPEQMRTLLPVGRSTIVDKVLAIGTIEPRREIQVKSKVTGVVARIFKEPGAYVRVGDPLLEVKPEATPTEMAEALRDIEVQEATLVKLESEHKRLATLHHKEIVSDEEMEDLEQKITLARLDLNAANDRLTLLKQGKVTINNVEYNSVIRAEINGYVLEKLVEEGDPVVASTSFQPGAPLMTLADMNELLFEGTVDEVNIGRVKVGMPVTMTIGALPGVKVAGTLSRIGLKARKKDNATSFDVEVTIKPEYMTQLRAGYSANAHIIVEKKDSVLTLPERLVIMRNDSQFVLIPDGPQKEREQAVSTGLSDAINIEIVVGLAEGDSVAEPPLKIIE